MLRTFLVLVASLFVFTPAHAEAVDKQVKCIADNIYYEAGNQSLTGKIAVANVVMNRMKQAGRFASTPCGVINQRVGRYYQFSWVPHRKIIRYPKLYKECIEIAHRVYDGFYGDVSNGALFYHATYVKPGWKYRVVARIGGHVFYRG